MEIGYCLEVFAIVRYERRIVAERAGGNPRIRNRNSPSLMLTRGGDLPAKNAHLWSTLDDRVSSQKYAQAVTPRLSPLSAISAEMHLSNSHEREI